MIFENIHELRKHLFAGEREQSHSDTHDHELLFSYGEEQSIINIKIFDIRIAHTDISYSKEFA